MDTMGDSEETSKGDNVHTKGVWRVLHTSLSTKSEWVSAVAHAQYIFAARACWLGAWPPWFDAYTGLCTFLGYRREISMSQSNAQKKEKIIFPNKL